MLEQLSKQDIFFIKENINKSNKELMNYLNLDYNKYLKKFKHLKEKLKFLNDETIQFIKDNSETLSCGEMNDLMKLPKGTVKLIISLCDIKVYKNKKFSYSKEEIDIVTNNYQKGVNYITKNFGISKMRIKTIATYLNLKSSRTYSEEQCKEIIKLYKECKDIDAIAEKYNKTAHAIENFLSRRGVLDSKKSSSKFYVTRPERYIINYMNEKINANIPNKREKSNRKYFYNVVGKYEIDVPIYINNYKFAIEYDGEKWHKDNEEHDFEKDKALRSAGYIVFRINSKDHQNNYYNLTSLDPVLDEIINKIELITGSL